MRQSSIAVPSGATLRPTRCTRPSRLVIVPVFSPQSVHGQEHVGAARGRRATNAPTAIDEAGAVDAALREVGVGEVGERIGAEQHEHVDLAVGGGAEDAGGVEPALARHRAPRARRTSSRAGVERDAAGQEAGREPGVERAVHVAAAQRREEPDVGHGRAARPRRP